MSGPLAAQPLVLVVEDELQDGRSLASSLATAGFRTLQAPARAGAMARAVELEPDLVLLEASHSGVDAVSLTTRLREWTPAPIVAILDAPRASRRGALLDAGASDYLVRPFAHGDLVARMRVWLRQKDRAFAQRAASDLTTERFRIDRDRRTLFVDGREVHITPLECKLLLVLAHNPGGAMTEAQILAAVWGSKASTRAQYLRAQVRQLRLKLEKDPNRPRYLVTEAGGGYRLKLG
jgi:two-component system KDP operon response regulator KdpE